MDIPDMGTSVSAPRSTAVDDHEVPKGHIACRVEFDSDSFDTLDFGRVSGWSDLVKSLEDMFPELEQTFAGMIKWTDKNGSVHEMTKENANTHSIEDVITSLVVCTNARFVECYLEDEDEDVQMISLPIDGGSYDVVKEKACFAFEEELEGDKFDELLYVDRDDQVFVYRESTNYQKIFDGASAIVVRRRKDENAPR